MAIIILIVLAIYIWSLWMTESDPARLRSQLPFIYEFIRDRFFPPDWEYFRTSFSYLVETWNMALIATTLAALISLPLTFLASNNINTNNTFYLVVRTALNLLRTIPDIVLAILVVAFMGLGSVSGVVALTIFTSGILAKMLSESTEGIDNGPLDAITASGGNKLQMIAFGVMPQIMPYYVSYTLYVLEINIKSSVVLGFIGAGGIGNLLDRNLSFFNYDRIMMIIIVIFITISIIDLISNAVREALL